MIKALWRNIQKDILIEFRSHIIVSIVLSFSVIVTISIGFATGGIINSPLLHAAILWIIIFFSGMNTLSHVFFREIEESTALFGVIHYPAVVIYLSKLLINCCVMVVIAIMVIIIYAFVISVSVYHGIYLMAILIAGSLSLAFATTVIGAIAALAGARGGLFTILAFPVVLPLFTVAIQSTARCFEQQVFSPLSAIIFLLAFSMVLGMVSYLLFPYIWREF